MTKVVASALVGALAMPALGQNTSPWERASIAVGGMIADIDSSAQIGLGGTGLEIDVEDVLDLDSSQSSFRVDALYRFGSSRRHRIDFTWFDLDRDGTKTLSRNIDVDGVTYPVGTTVQSEFDLAFYNVRYSYSFVHDDRIDLAGSIGLHVTEVGLSVSSAAQGKRGEDVTAPLPVLGVRLDVLLAPKWYVRTSWEVLYLAYDGAEGAISDAMVAVEYRPWQRFALGAGLNAVRFRLEGEEGSDFPELDVNAKFELDYTGLLLYGKLMF
jgi:hypothetical protein